jgi:hypothetical protein
MQERPIHFRTTLTPEGSPFRADGNNNAIIYAAAPQNIPNTDIIIENGKQRQIRFINAAQTIYVDEQIKLGYPMNYVFNPTDKIELLNGSIYLYPSKHANKIEYLRKCSYNRDSKYRRPNATAIFYEYNPIDKAQKDLETFTLISEAVAIIAEIKGNKPMIYSLGKAFGYQEYLEVEEVLSKLAEMAQKSPKMVIAAYKNTRSEAEEIIQYGFETGIIAANQSKVYWADSGNTIMGFKIGDKKDIIRSKLHTYFTSTEEGKVQLKMLKTLVDEHKNRELAKAVVE